MPVDRTREFALPGIQKLNKDQDEALALPLEGQHLIVGGPGTGKSVVALLRAQRLARKGKTYRTLVYNRLLDHANHHLFGNEQDFDAETWDSWFRGIYSDFLNEDVPTLEPDKPGGYRPINWEAVEQRVQTLGKSRRYNIKFLVIDEGQDMPPPFYRTLINLGFENFYVVADQSQQIHPDKCSSRLDIENALAIEPGDTLELKTNYRNTRPIAQLAQHFYPDDPASPRPKLPDNVPAATPKLWTYDTANTALAAMADNILKLSDRNPRKLIGIITPNNEVRKKFKMALDRANPELDNDKPPIQTYASGQQNDLPDFGQGGVVVINAQSCKGLEFDTAILADIDQHQPKYDPHALKARFYVMVARAREQVILLRTGDSCPIMDGLLPDHSILVRK